MPSSSTLAFNVPLDESLSIVAIVLGVVVLCIAVLYLVLNRRHRGRLTRH